MWQWLISHLCFTTMYLCRCWWWPGAHLQHADWSLAKPAGGTSSKRLPLRGVQSEVHDVGQCMLSYGILDSRFKWSSCSSRTNANDIILYWEKAMIGCWEYTYFCGSSCWMQPPWLCCDAVASGIPHPCLYILWSYLWHRASSVENSVVIVNTCTCT